MAIPSFGGPFNYGVKGPDIATPFELQAGQNQNALAQMQIAQKQQEMQGMNALRGMMSDPSFLGPDGQPTPNGLAKIYSVDPRLGQHVASQMQQKQLHDAQIQHYQMLTAKEAQDIKKMQLDAQIKLAPYGIDIMAGQMRAFDDNLKKFGDPSTAQTAAIEFGRSRVDELDSAGFLGNHKDKFLEGVNNFNRVTAPSSLETAKSFLAKQKAEEAPPKMQTRIEGENEVQERFNAATGKWEEIGRGPRFARQVAPVVNVSAGGESGKPMTDIGKLNADLKAGRITQEQFDKVSAKKGGASTVQEKMNPVMLASVMLDMKEVDYGLAEIEKLATQTASPFFEDAHGGNFAMRMLKKYGTPDERQQYDVLANRFSQAIASMQAMGRGQITDARIAEAKKLVPVPGDTKAAVRTKLNAIRKIRNLTEETLKTPIRSTRTEGDDQQDVNDFSSLWK